MLDTEKTREQLLEELVQLRQRVQALEQRQALASPLQAAIQPEEPLQSQHNFFAALTQMSPGLLYLFDVIEQRCTYVNIRSQDLLGYTPEAILAMGADFMAKRMHPMDFAQMSAYFEQFTTIPEGSFLGLEYRMQHINGEWRWFSSHDTVFSRTADGSVHQILGTAQDITDRKRAELQLQESQRFIQQIANSLPGTLYVYDLLEQRNVYVNRQIGDLLGYTPEQIQAFGDQLFLQLIHPEDFATIDAQLDRLHQAQDGEVIDYEYRMRHANGEWCWLWSRNTISTRLPDGRVHQIVGTVHDITRYKQTERSLRQSEERLRLAMEGAQMGTWDVDLKTGKAIWSEQHFTMMGYEPVATGEASEQMWCSRIHPDDVERVIHAWQQARQDHTLYSAEYRVIRADNGQIAWLAGLGSFTYDRTGEAIRSIGVLFDITARKQAEAALAESNQTLQAVVQACPLAVMGLRADGTVCLWNPAAEQIFGWSEQEVLGKFLPTIPDHKRDEFLNNLAITAQEHGLVGVETQRQRKGNILLDVELWSAPLDETQAGISCLSIVADITERKRVEAERKQTEESLRQSEERYRYLAESIPQLIWTATAEGALIDVNQRWSTFTGLTLAQAQTEGWAAVVHPEDISVLGQNWAAAQQTSTYYQAEGRMRRADGVYRWHLHQAIPLKNGQGQLIKWFGTATDIEDQKQLEQQRFHLLQQEQAAREQAEAANRVKDEFLAILSHELRTPLNPILGWAKLLRSRQFDPQTTDRALETIERSAKLQAQLIEDLLDVSRILQGKIKLDAHPTNLTTTIEAALETVRLSAEAKGIQIETLLDPEVGQVNGDASRLQQVIWNLLSNAVKFTPMGGRITVRLKPVAGGEVEGWRSGASPLPPYPSTSAYAQIQISDTGQGISPDFLPHVFEYFRQADSSTTRQFGGLGLGLAIVRHLVELHGGTVKAESPGNEMGATFTVLLPLMESTSPPVREILPTQIGKHLSGFRILVVDDEADMRELLRFILEEQGATVMLATSALEALQQLDQSPPNLLISDIGMPGMDGYALVRQIHTTRPNLPAIALTAYAGDFDQQQAKQAGFHRHIPKPVEPDTLVETIAALLGRTILP